MSEDVVPVTVFVRVRPMSQKEKREANSVSVQALTATNQIKCNGKIFAFDSVLGQTSTQGEVYDVTTLPIVEKYVSGFNCTMLAYGQTGSGKTFTMGTEETTNSMQSESRGIIPRLVNDLFDRISRQEYPEAFNVSVSMLEIYDEKIHDLLIESANKESREGLAIREQNGEVFVKNLSQISVDNLEKTMKQLEKGCQNRTKGETAMNAQSSRSHAIFTILLQKQQMTEEDTSYVAKLHLVDLAGSERAKKTMAEGERLREGIKINEGLLALGNVISILAEPGTARHVPYRDSKITRLLQDSLGGNSLTIMIACVSPADSNSDETLSTLRYADRAKKIKNKPVVNVDPDKQTILDLREQIQLLTKELAQYRAGMVPDVYQKNTSNEQDGSCYKEEIVRLENQLQDARSKLAAALVREIKFVRKIEQYEEDRDTIRKCPEVAQSILDILQSPNSEEANEGDPSMDTENDSQIENHEQAEEADRERFNHLESLTNKLANIQNEIDSTERRMKQEEVNNENVEKLISELRSRQQEIADLQAERDKLSAELKKIGTSSKLAEERRRRLNELEKQISLMKRQVVETKKLEKQKKDAEDIMKKMRSDLVELKRIKVKMSKEARAEAEKYRKWKASMELQLANLRKREQRATFELAREKKAKDQQIIVMKTRLQEAQRTMKRLETQNQKITQASESKGDPTSIKKMTEELLEGYSTHYKLQKIAEDLRDQRNRINRELSKLRMEPAKKKRRTDETSTATDSEVVKQEQEKQASLDLINMELVNVSKSDASFNWDRAVENILKCVTTSQRSSVKQMLEMVKEERTNALEQTFRADRCTNENKELKQEKKNLKAESKISKEEYRTGILNECRQMRQFRSEYADKYNQLVSLIATNQAPDEHLMNALTELGSQLAVEEDLVPLLSKKCPKEECHQHYRRRSHTNIFPNFSVEAVEELVDGPRRTRCKKNLGDMDDTHGGNNDETFVCNTSKEKEAVKRPKRMTRARNLVANPPSPIINQAESNSERRQSRFFTQGQERQESPEFNTTFTKDEDQENLNGTFDVRRSADSKSGRPDVVPPILNSSPANNLTLGPVP